MKQLLPWLHMRNYVLRIGKQRSAMHQLHANTFTYKLHKVVTLSDVWGYTLKLELNLDKKEYVIIDGLDVLHVFPDSLLITLLENRTVRIDPLTRDHFQISMINVCIALGFQFQQIPASNIWE